MRDDVCGVRWERAALLASPLFHTVHPLIEALPAECFPDCTTLNLLAQRRALFNANGVPIRFVLPQGDAKIAACDYEGRAYRTGEVLTRPDNWHDLFNALAWLSFPRTKALINRLHVAELARQHGSTRNVARDVLTLFDEGGMIVACSDPALTELLHQFQWKRLFWERRDDVAVHMRFFVFGHAIHEKALAPYKGITAKAICVAVEPDFAALKMAERLDRLDVAAAAALSESQALASTAMLQPLPILGIPGWAAENEQPAYYDDVQHFRPGRMRARSKSK